MLMDRYPLSPQGASASSKLQSPRLLKTLCRIVMKVPITGFRLQQNFSGSNTDGSFTMAISNLFLILLEKLP